MSELNGAINQQLAAENEQLRQQVENLSIMLSAAGWVENMAHTLARMEMSLQTIAQVLENRSRGYGTPL